MSYGDFLVYEVAVAKVNSHSQYLADSNLGTGANGCMFRYTFENWDLVKMSRGFVMVGKVQSSGENLITY